MTYSELRASDAERERVVTFMREHALLGRLSDDELEERIGLAYASVTVGDLERLIADLPRAGRPAPRPHLVAQPRRELRQRRHVPPAAIAAAVVGFLMLGGPAVLIGGTAVVFALALALVAAVFALSFAFGPFILIGLLIAAVARRRRASQRPMHWGPTHY
jgi:hypothetical protein